MKHSIYIIIVLLLVFSCKDPEARRPKKHSVNNFYKEVIAQNKKLNQLENERIHKVISKDTIHDFESSKNGFWYAFIKKDSIHKVYPKTNDVVTLTYNVSTIFNQPVYDEKEITYRVDKQDFIPGLQEGIKLLKEGEKAVFIIPSYAAYGVTGDGDKININQTIKSTIELIKIEKNNEKN